MKPGHTPRPRKKVVQILQRVLNDGQSVDQAMSEVGIENTQRAWVLDCVQGVLRFRGRLDFIIEQIADKKKPTGFLRKALWLGCYQILNHDVPPAKTVSETVSWIKEEEGVRSSQFANALLRKVENYKYTRPGIWNEDWASLPKWIWERLVQQYGEDQAYSFSEGALRAPDVLCAAPIEPLKKVMGLESGPLKGSYLICDSSLLKSHHLYDAFDDQWIVQDLSSQMVVKKVAKLLKSENVKTVLDLCAAPGGKAIHLAWLGFEVTATDFNEERLKRLNENIDRTRSQVRSIAYEKALKLKDCDSVWIDAPCSGMGTLRKNPEIRWNRTEKDLQSLLKIQKQLLTQALKQVKEGGVLVYSVCSILKEEGAHLIREFFSANQLIEENTVGIETADGFYYAICRCQKS